VKRIVILVSGRGSNMEAIVRACAEQGWPAQVVAVLANRADAQAWPLPPARGIATEVVEHRAFASREAFDEALAQAIDRHRPDLVVLAGFMRVLGAAFTARYAGRLLNIHPSLLPAFPGLHTHRRALQAGCKVAGATVHFVTAELDHGPIVMQSVVPVRPATTRRAWPRACSPPSTGSTLAPWAGSCATACASRTAACASSTARRSSCSLADARSVGIAQQIGFFGVFLASSSAFRFHSSTHWIPSPMHPGALLDLATALLKAVLRLDQPADRVVSAFFREHRTLGPRERHTLAETAYAVLRRRLLLQHLAQSGGGALERRLAILGWQGSARLPARRPHAGRAAAGWPRSRRWTAASCPSGCATTCPPGWPTPCASGWASRTSPPLAAALDEPAPLDLRVNALKARREEAQAALQAPGVESEPTPYSPWGLRVADKPALTRLAPFERGEVEVQDEGSQLLALLTGARARRDGGGLLRRRRRQDAGAGRHDAQHRAPVRLRHLRPPAGRAQAAPGAQRPVQRAPGARSRTSATTASSRLDGKIDRVLVDAPCSGLGTLRRNPDLKWRQSPESVRELQAQQRSILAQAARLLRPGGRLVYATCSLLREENEEVAAAFSRGPRGASSSRWPAGRPAGARRGWSAPPRLDDAGCLRLWPHRHHTDGFFAAGLAPARLSAGAFGFRASGRPGVLPARLDAASSLRVFAASPSPGAAYNR
jgi:formyltetrahydrofolate-dependent phosphoribosylglycinamide formyltransferase